MTEYRVHFESTGSVSVKVEAEDHDEAIEKAYEDLPGGICAQCSGWGEEWSRDEGDEYEPVVVIDPEGNEVWRAESEVPVTCLIPQKNSEGERS